MSASWEELQKAIDRYICDTTVSRAECIERAEEVISHVETVLQTMREEEEDEG